MEIDYGTLKKQSGAVAAALAAVRSVRNLQTRQQRAEASEERVAESARRRKKTIDDREAEAFLKRRIRVKVAKGDRPRIGATTARRLYHRESIRLLKGTTGFASSRGPDRLNSIHFSFVSRGFGSRNVRRWRAREAERAARYAARESALEGGEAGWWSNIAEDRNELAAHYRASEELEKHDRENASVYIAEVLELPAELTARQRRLAVRRICQWFEVRGLPYTVGIHLPDPGGDQRNYHLHIVYSLRPCRRIAPYEWEFAVAKNGEINTPAGILERRKAVVRAINATLHAASVDKRYTHLSNKARGLPPPVCGKQGQQQTWLSRRAAAFERRVTQLKGLGNRVADVRSVIINGHDRLHAARMVIVAHANELAKKLVETRPFTFALEPYRGEVRWRLGRHVETVCEIKDRAIGAQMQVRETARARLDGMETQVNAVLDDRRIPVARARLHGAINGISARTRQASDAGAARFETVTKRKSQNSQLREISDHVVKRVDDGRDRYATASILLKKRVSEVSDRVRLRHVDIGPAMARVAEKLAAFRTALDASSPRSEARKLRLHAAQNHLRRDQTRSSAKVDLVRELARSRAEPPSVTEIESPQQQVTPMPAPSRGAGNLDGIAEPETSPAASVSSPEKSGPVERFTDAEGESLRVLAEKRAAKLRKAAWDKLAAANATVAIATDGTYFIETAGLTDPERIALLAPAHSETLQRSLASRFLLQHTAEHPAAAATEHPEELTSSQNTKESEDVNAAVLREWIDRNGGKQK